jgi:hypothetical protein
LGKLDRRPGWLLVAFINYPISGILLVFPAIIQDWARSGLLGSWSRLSDACIGVLLWLWLVVGASVLASLPTILVVGWATRTLDWRRPPKFWRGFAIGLTLVTIFVFQASNPLRPLQLNQFAVLLSAIAACQAVGVWIDTGRRVAFRSVRRRATAGRFNASARNLARAVASVAISGTVVCLAMRASGVAGVQIALVEAFAILSVTWLPLCVYAERAVAARGWFRRKRAAR